MASSCLIIFIRGHAYLNSWNDNDSCTTVQWSVWVYNLPSGTSHNPLCISASCHLSAFCALLYQHQATFANTLELPSLCIQGQYGKHLSWMFSGTTDKHSCKIWPPINVTTNCAMTNNLWYSQYLGDMKSSSPLHPFTHPYPIFPSFPMEI